MISTYGELKTTVAQWLDREDLAGVIPSFIRLAEEDIFDGLRCHDNEFTTTITSTEYTLGDNPPIATTDDLIYALPSNYREMKLVTWNDTPVQQVSQQRLQQVLTTLPSNQVAYFAIFDHKISFVSPLGPIADWDDAQTLVYRYYGTESLDAMPSYQTQQNPVETPPVPVGAPEDNVQSDTNTNRMLQHNPMIYLYATMRHAYIWLQQPERATFFEAQYMQARQRLEVTSSELQGSTATVINAYTA